MNDWRLQEAHNEVRFRDRNERILQTTTNSDEDVWFVCECGDRTCTTSIHLGVPEYEAVRADATTFAIALNHENPECEAVVTENDRYATVTKIYPPARNLARQTNPRR